MSPLSLQQFKDSLQSEANDIEKKLDRGQNTQANVQRLEKINTMLATIDIMEKPDSMYKKAMNL